MELLLSHLIETFSTIAMIFYVLGIVLLIVELFIPGFGVFGISGLSLLAISIITKFIIGESLLKTMIELLIALAVIIVLLTVVIISAKKGVISRSSLVSKGSSIPSFYNDDNLRLYIDKTGQVITTCKPIGKITLDGETFEAESLDGFLDKGTKIVAVSVKNNTLQIKKEENKNEN